MPTLLHLPWELYLIICADLQPTDLTRLAGVSRDHYLAAQQPLYERIRITKYRNLIKLVDALNKVPVVSTISPQQRLRWYKLSDAQLRERDIKHLDLIINAKEDRDSYRITGAVLARCVGAIARKCYAVKINLTIDGAWSKFVNQLQDFGLPNVTKLTLRLGAGDQAPAGDEVDMSIWDLVFSGACFSDLKDVYMDTWHANSTTLENSVGCAYDVHDRFPTGTSAANAHGDTAAPFYGLRNMERVVLAHNSLLTLSIMQSLFGSDIIPQRLTTLEIVDCPSLRPVKHLAALCTLLERSLQLVKHLKLHLCKLLGSSQPQLSLMQYNARIQEHPEEHPCNIIRKFSQNIPHLDLALPFACANILPAPTKKAKAQQCLELPDIALEPYESLPSRLKGAGYKYRRLICWQGVCRASHKWYDMGQAAQERVEGHVSWELLSWTEDLGSWQVGGCLPVQLRGEDILRRPFPAVTEA